MRAVLLLSLWVMVAFMRMPVVHYHDATSCRLPCTSLPCASSPCASSPCTSSCTSSPCASLPSSDPHHEAVKIWLRQWVYDGHNHDGHNHDGPGIIITGIMYIITRSIRIIPTIRIIHRQIIMMDHLISHQTMTIMIKWPLIQRKAFRERCRCIFKALTHEELAGTVNFSGTQFAVVTYGAIESGGLLTICAVPIGALA